MLSNPIINKYGTRYLTINKESEFLHRINGPAKELVEGDTSFDLNCVCNVPGLGRSVCTVRHALESKKEWYLYGRYCIRMPLSYIHHDFNVSDIMEFEHYWGNKYFSIIMAKYLNEYYYDRYDIMIIDNNNKGYKFLHVFEWEIKKMREL